MSNRGMGERRMAAWLEDQPWHRIRNEMLLSPAWRAATHLQRSMVFALLTELGRHGGKNNGDLIFTNRNLQALGFSRDAIKPNMIAIEALGFINFKRGRPGLKGYGKARRIRITFLPTIDAEGKETEPPTDEWAKFATTEEAKMAANRAQIRGHNYKNRSRNRTTSVVVQKSDHVAAKRNRKASAETPMNTGPAVSEIGPLSTSTLQGPPLGAGDKGEAKPDPRMQQYAGVGTGKYVVSTDPQAMQQYYAVVSDWLPDLRLGIGPKRRRRGTRLD